MDIGNITLTGGSYSTARTVIFRANSTETMRISSAGNVTVGSASQSLANLNISAAGGIGGGLLINRNATGFVTSGQYLGSVGFKGTDSANSNAAADAAIVAKASETHSGSTITGTDLEFYTKPSGTGPGSSPLSFASPLKRGISVVLFNKLKSPRQMQLPLRCQSVM